jgi:hypothetical protein
MDTTDLRQDSQNVFCPEEGIMFLTNVDKDLPEYTASY